MSAGINGSAGTKVYQAGPFTAGEFQMPNANNNKSTNISHQESTQYMKRNLEIWEATEKVKNGIKNAQHTSTDRSSPKWKEAEDRAEILKQSLFDLNQLIPLERDNSEFPQLYEDRWRKCQEDYIELSNCLDALKDLGLSEEQITKIRRPFSKQLILLFLLLLLFTKSLHTCMHLFGDNESLPSQIKVPSEEKEALNDATSVFDLLGVAISKCKPNWLGVENYTNQTFQTARKGKGRAVLYANDAIKKAMGDLHVAVDTPLPHQPGSGTTSFVPRGGAIDDQKARRRWESDSDYLSVASSSSSGLANGEGGSRVRKRVQNVYINAANVHINASPDTTRGTDSIAADITTNKVLKTTSEPQPQDLASTLGEQKTDMSSANKVKAEDEAAQRVATGSGENRASAERRYREIIEFENGMISRRIVSDQPSACGEIRSLGQADSPMHFMKAEFSGHAKGNSNYSTRMEQALPDGGVVDVDPDSAEDSSDDEVLVNGMSGVRGSWTHARVQSLPIRLNISSESKLKAWLAATEIQLAVTQAQLDLRREDARKMREILSMPPQQLSTLETQDEESHEDLEPDYVDVQIIEFMNLFQENK